jgi:hypothetical protein
MDAKRVGKQNRSPGKASPWARALYQFPTLFFMPGAHLRLSHPSHFSSNFLITLNFTLIFTFLSPPDLGLLAEPRALPASRLLVKSSLDAPMTDRPTLSSLLHFAPRFIINFALRLSFHFPFFFRMLCTLWPAKRTVISRERTHTVMILFFLFLTTYLVIRFCLYPLLHVYAFIQQQKLSAKRNSREAIIKGYY